MITHDNTGYIIYSNEQPPLLCLLCEDQFIICQSRTVADDSIHPT